MRTANRELRLTMISDRIQSLADALFMPWVVAVLLGAGLFLTLRSASSRSGVSRDACRVAFVTRTSSAAPGR